MNSRQKNLSLVALVVVAGLAGMGLSRLPPRSEQGSGGGQLLISSSIGATSATLFVLDPATKYLAAYEAVPGENGGLRLLGARKIEHDLELAKYRDLSEFSFFDLREKKGEVGGNPVDEAKRSQAGERR